MYNTFESFWFRNISNDYYLKICLFVLKCVDQLHLIRKMVIENLMFLSQFNIHTN